jgi:hypothetical protein
MACPRGIAVGGLGWTLSVWFRWAWGVLGGYLEGNGG